MKAWIILLIIVIFSLGYLYYTNQGIDFSNLKHSVVNTFKFTINQEVQESNIKEKEDPLISSCKEDFKFNADIRYSKSRNEIVIENIQEIQDSIQAKDFLKMWGYDAFYPKEDTCENVKNRWSDWYKLCNKDYPIVIIIASYDSMTPEYGGRLSIPLFCDNTGKLDEYSRSVIVR